MGITIVIPTLDKKRGHATGRLAQLTAGIETALVVSHDTDRIGFTRTSNMGIRRADKTHDICLLNDDVKVFHYGWLAVLHAALYHKADYGIVGPSGGSNTRPMRDGKLGDAGLQVVHHLPFWCVLIKRALLDEIGLLDERFIHYASDNFFCDVARKRGWKSVWCRDVWLGHRRHGSGLQSEWKKRDQALYKRRREGKG